MLCLGTSVGLGHVFVGSVYISYPYRIGCFASCVFDMGSCFGN